MDYAWTRFVVLLLGDPHLLESAEGGKDGPSNPHTVLPLRGSYDLDLHCVWCKRSDFFLHSVCNTWIHGAASRKNGVGIEIFADVHVTFHDGVECHLVNTRGFHSQKRWAKQSLWASESLVSDGYDLSVWKLVSFFKAGTAGGIFQLLFKVECNIAQFLLDVADNLALGSGGEGVATLRQDLHQVVGKITAGQVKTKDCVRKGISLVNGNSMRYAISRVEHDAGCIYVRKHRGIVQPGLPRTLLEY